MKGQQERAETYSWEADQGDVWARCFALLPDAGGLVVAFKAFHEP